MMTSKRLILAILFVFQFSTLLLKAEPQNSLKPFALITMPKSGTHMLIKAVHLMTGGVPIWHQSIPAPPRIPPKEGFLFTHFCLSPQLEEEYAQLPKLKKILLIRDLRDICLSIINHIKKGSPWPGIDDNLKAAFLQASFDEQLLFVINYENDLASVASDDPEALQVSIQKVAEQAVRLAQNPHHLVCHYEKLVGIQGGGSKIAQIQELIRIANYIGFKTSKKNIQAIAIQLYGDEYNPFGQNGFKNYQSTFQSGKIGAWKTAFKQEHKDAFKAKLGHFLIALGYEEDNNW